MRATPAASIAKTLSLSRSAGSETWISAALGPISRWATLTAARNALLVPYGQRAGQFPYDLRPMSSTEEKAPLALRESLQRS